MNKDVIVVQHVEDDHLHLVLKKKSQEYFA